MPLSVRSVLDWVFGLSKPKMKKESGMSNDIVVCGVTRDEFIEDIGKLVPQGVATTISAEKAHKSRDLWVLLSQGRLFQLNVNPLLRIRGAAQEEPPAKEDGNALEVLQAEYNKAVAELQKVRGELAVARSELISVRSELAVAMEKVQRLEKESEQASKLDDILKLLKERPEGSSVNMHVSAVVPEPALDDVPMYIPSQIKGEAIEGRVVVKEESASASALENASKALREKRKKQ